MIRDRWRMIREDIEQDIRKGVLAPGDKLPTEPELAERYGAGRHSIRRAVAELAREGQLSIEQGRGTFVQPQPMIDYAIGRRTRLRRNLRGQVMDIGGELLSSDRIPAEGRPARELGLGPADEVVVTRSLTLADELPIAVGALYHDAARFAEFAARRRVLGSVSETYRSYGIEDYLRGRTSVHARPARGEEAKLLRQHPDLPVLVVRAVDTMLDGAPLSYGEVVWSAARVSFSFTPEEEE